MIFNYMKLMKSNLETYRAIDKVVGIGHGFFTIKFKGLGCFFLPLTHS